MRNSLFARNKWFLLACAIAALAGLEVGGKGTGIVAWLLSPSVTRDEGPHPIDLVSPRPKGPVRLGKVEAELVDERLGKAFGREVPKHERTSGLWQYFTLRADARCVRNRIDLVECNKMAKIDGFLYAVLGLMHSGTEHIMWLQIKSSLFGPGKGRAINLAVFLGNDEKIKWAFDMRWADLGDFVARENIGGALRTLSARALRGGILVVEDPGYRAARTGRREMLVYASRARQPEPEFIVGTIIEGATADRHRFFSAVTGKPVDGME